VNVVQVSVTLLDPPALSTDVLPKFVNVPPVHVTPAEQVIAAGVVYPPDPLVHISLEEKEAAELFNTHVLPDPLTTVPIKPVGTPVTSYI
jgi:hypothetical protein